MSSRRARAVKTHTPGHSDHLFPARRWCFTFWPKDCDVVPEWNGDDILRYAVCQPEISPENGQLHWQGYAEFKKPVRHSAVQKVLAIPNAHCEPAYKPGIACYKYCTKNETRCGDESQICHFGDGPCPAEEKAITQGSRTDLEHAVKLAIDGRYEEIPLTTYARYGRGIRETAALHAKKRCTARIQPEVFVFWGPPRTGKTTAARKLLSERFPAEAHRHVPITFKKGATEWFPDYDGEKGVIFDEYSGGTDFDLFLGYIGADPRSVQKKGSHVAWVPEVICITSNLHPSAWFPGEQKRYEALLGRINYIIHLEKRRPEVKMAKEMKYSEFLRISEYGKVIEELCGDSYETAELYDNNELSLADLLK